MAVVLKINKEGSKKLYAILSPHWEEKQGINTLLKSGGIIFKYHKQVQDYNQELSFPESILLETASKTLVTPSIIICYWL